MIDAFCITRTRYFSMLRKERFGLTVTANITGFNLDDSVFGAIMIIAADNSSQTVNYALGDADAPRTFGSVPYSEIMTVIKTSKCRGVECGRHSQPGVSFSDKRQLSNMAILAGSNICPAGFDGGVGIRSPCEKCPCAKNVTLRQRIQIIAGVNDRSARLIAITNRRHP